MRLYGILKDDLIGEYIIDNTSTNIEDFKHIDNVYYTDNLSQNDLSRQIEEVAKDKLLDYYTENLEELKFEEW